MFLVTITLVGLIIGILLNRKRKALDILHRAAVFSIIFFILGVAVAITFGR